MKTKSKITPSYTYTPSAFQVPANSQDLAVIVDSFLSHTGEERLTIYGLHFRLKTAPKTASNIVHDARLTSSTVTHSSQLNYPLHNAHLEHQRRASKSLTFRYIMGTLSNR